MAPRRLTVLLVVALVCTACGSKGLDVGTVEPRAAGNGDIAYSQPGGAIWVMRADGSHRRNLADETGRVTGLAWGLSGTRLAYTAADTLAIVDDQGAMRARVVPDESGIGPDGSVPSAPAWSPDDESLAFANGPRGSGEIDVLNIDSAAVLSAVERDGGAGRPSWGPTGRELYYETGGAVYKLDVTDGKATMLVAGTDPAASPDGSTVAFVRDGRLRLVGADGSRDRAVPGGDGLDSPAWSPDGKTLLALRGDALVRLAPDGSDLRVLVPSGVSAAAWQPRPTAGS